MKKIIFLFKCVISGVVVFSFIFEGGHDGHDMDTMDTIENFYRVHIFDENSRKTAIYPLKLLKI